MIDDMSLIFLLCLQYNDEQDITLEPGMVD